MRLSRQANMTGEALLTRNFYYFARYSLSSSRSLISERTWGVRGCPSTHVAVKDTFVHVRVTRQWLNSEDPRIYSNCNTKWGKINKNLKTFYYLFAIFLSSWMLCYKFHSLYFLTPLFYSFLRNKSYSARNTLTGWAHESHIHFKAPSFNVRVKPRNVK